RGGARGEGSRAAVEVRREEMRAKQLIGSAMLIAMLLAACNRKKEQNFRLSTASDAANNPSSNVAPANPIPGVSYADVVSKVAPAVVTIHSQMRVRQPQQF